MLKELLQNWLGINEAIENADQALGYAVTVGNELDETLIDDRIEFSYITNLQDAIKALEDEVETLKVLIDNEDNE